MTYDELLKQGAKAQRLQHIGSFQAALLNSLREQNFAFVVGGFSFNGPDSARIRMALVRELEAMSQEGVKELEAEGVTFPPPLMPPTVSPDNGATETPRPEETGASHDPPATKQGTGQTLN